MYCYYKPLLLHQEYTRLCDHPSLHYYPSVGHDSFITTGLSEHSQDDSISMQKLALGHSFLQLADAQVFNIKSAEFQSRNERNYRYIYWGFTY